MSCLYVVIFGIRDKYSNGTTMSLISHSRCSTDDNIRIINNNDNGCNTGLTEVADFSTIRKCIRYCFDIRLIYFIKVLNTTFSNS